MRPHPLGVLPEGNRYLVSPEAAAASARARLEGLGAFAALPDALLMRLLSGGDEDDGVGAEALASLCLVSRVFRAFACHEDLWKAEVLRRDGGAFVFRGASWRETYRRGVSAAADRAGDDGRDDARENANDSPNIHHSRHPRIFSDALYSRHLAMHRPLDQAWLEKETIPVMRVPEGVRTEAQTKALASEFVDAYEKKNAPVILRGACAEWEAVRNDAWSLPALRRRLTNENVQTFHVGGYEVPLKNWERYCEASRPADEGGSGPVDDAPLYLFDKNFVATAPEAFCAGSSESEGMYEPPKFICSKSDDLFSLLPNRPDFRWFIHGPARSGSLFHVDPNGTSAWNAVVSGAKRWILFNPNGLPPPGVHPSVDGATVAQPVTLVEWYASFYEHAYPESETEKSDSEEEEESAGEDEDVISAPTKTQIRRILPEEKRIFESLFGLSFGKTTPKKNVRSVGRDVLCRRRAVRPERVVARSFKLDGNRGGDAKLLLAANGAESFALPQTRRGFGERRRRQQEPRRRPRERARVKRRAREPVFRFPRGAAYTPTGRAAFRGGEAGAGRGRTSGRGGGEGGEGGGRRRRRDPKTRSFARVAFGTGRRAEKTKTWRDVSVALPGNDGDDDAWTERSGWAVRRRDPGRIQRVRVWVLVDVNVVYDIFFGGRIRRSLRHAGADSSGRGQSPDGRAHPDALDRHQSWLDPPRGSLQDLKARADHFPADVDGRLGVSRNRSPRDDSRFSPAAPVRQSHEHDELVQRVVVHGRAGLDQLTQ
jgi:hypothetical protein